MDVLDLKVAHFNEHRLAAILRVTPDRLRKSIVNHYDTFQNHQAVGRSVLFFFWYHSHRFDLMKPDDVVHTEHFHIRYRTAVARRVGARPSTSDLIKTILLHLDDMEEKEHGSKAMLMKPSAAIPATDRKKRDDLFSDLKKRCGSQVPSGLTNLLIAARKAEESTAVKHARELKGLPAIVTTWEGPLVRIVARVFIKFNFRPATYAQTFTGVIKDVVAKIQKKFGTQYFTENAIRKALVAQETKINRWIDRLQTEEDIWKEGDAAWAKQAA